MGQHRPTMKDVAALANVSVKTVSRVVNREQWVSDDAAERVQVAIAELGYRLDARARAMRNPALAGRTVGVIHADLANPFFASVHSGIEEVVGAAGWLILTASSGDLVERQDMLLRTFSDRRVDGMIVIPAAEGAAASSPTTALEQERRHGMPCVFVDRKHDDDSDLVISDNFGGAVDATRHLLSHGHRDIAFFGDDERLYTAKRRQRAFLETMAAADLETPWVFMNVTTEDQAAEKVRSLLASDHRPTALFTGKNHSTAGAVQALHRLDLQREIALIGFDDVAMGNVIEPGISVVAQDSLELGRVAGQLLLERIVDGRTRSTQRTIPVQLIARGSGEIASAHGRGADEHL